MLYRAVTADTTSLSAVGRSTGISQASSRRSAWWPRFAQPQSRSRLQHLHHCSLLGQLQVHHCNLLYTIAQLVDVFIACTTPLKICVDNLPWYSKMMALPHSCTRCTRPEHDKQPDPCLRRDPWGCLLQALHAAVPSELPQLLPCCLHTGKHLQGRMACISSGDQVRGRPELAPHASSMFVQRHGVSDSNRYMLRNLETQKISEAQGDSANAVFVTSRRRSR